VRKDSRKWGEKNRGMRRLDQNKRAQLTICHSSQNTEKADVRQKKKRNRGRKGRGRSGHFPPSSGVGEEVGTRGPSTRYRCRGDKTRMKKSVGEGTLFPKRLKKTQKCEKTETRTSELKETVVRKLQGPLRPRREGKRTIGCRGGGKHHVEGKVPP